MNATVRTFKMVGITDERDTCELCGKTHLKRVVVLQNIESGDFVFYGCDCAATALKMRMSAVEAQFEMISFAKRMIAKWGVEKGLRAIHNNGYSAELKGDKIVMGGGFSFSTNQ